MAKNTNSKKEERLTFRMTPEQKVRLQKLAARLEKTPAELVRGLVLQELGRLETAA